MSGVRIPDGAWEEKYVIGTRLEIKKNVLTVLWMSSPVLTSPFSVATEKEVTLIVPKEREMRYTGDSRPYATLSRLEWRGGEILMEEDFPITGKSEKLLSPTENSRYGNVKIVDGEILPALKGKWKSDDGYHEFEIKKNKLIARGETLSVHAVRNPSGMTELVHDDPGVRSLLDFSTLQIADPETIFGTIPICDAPAVRIVFKKVRA